MAETKSLKTSKDKSVKLVKKQPAPKATPKPVKADSEDPVSDFWLDPEHVGRLLHERPKWVDEIIAMIFIVCGIVSLLALFNVSSTPGLSTAWATMIQQACGNTGAILLSIMIMAAGALIALPRMGVRTNMTWQRILVIEIAYLCLLALLHLLAHDPEPRALARAGQGGGYIGWALSEPVSKFLGSGMAITLYGVVMLICLANAIGIRRKHIGSGLVAFAHALEAFAEEMRNEPPQVRAEKVRQALDHRVQQVKSIFARPAASPSEDGSEEPRREPRPKVSGPMAKPLRGRQDTAAPTNYATFAAQDATLPPPAPLPSIVDTAPQAPAVAAESAAAPVQSAPRINRSSKPSSKPSAPAPAETPKPARYFTVEDFKESRQAIERSSDLPPLTLLSDLELNKPTEQEINTNARIIENTLLEFDIDVEVVDVSVGPTVTQYAVQPFREVTNDQGEVVLQRVRVNKIASLSNDLALALSAKRLRIQPYVPGRNYMGIEVPNRTPSVVALRPVMESENFAKVYINRDPEAASPTRPLSVPLGRDVSGTAFVVDLATMPHLLIAGTTGSGKSVCITALAVALVMNNLPDRLKLVLLDPKMVELTRFNGLPHLLGPVETDMERIIGVLRWATREMDRRYKLLEAEATRNIEAYNRKLGKDRQAEQLPYIVIMIDEIGDLMLSRPEEMERTLTRLAQMARAVGMHLVVATQRPSVDIITGLIKANFPARISFAVASGVDSRVILDATGAETLMGRGDMLYLASDAPVPQRLQGCFVADDEIDKVVNYWRNWSTKPRTESTVENASEIAPWERGITRRESLAEVDPLLEDTIDLVVREGEATPSLIQRRLGIGYPRAAQLMDMLTELGVVSAASDGGRARQVLIKPGTDQYKRLIEKHRR